MKTYLGNEKQRYFDSLIALMRSGDITDEQEAELIALRRELQRNKQERSNHLASIRTMIAELGVSIEELFVAEAIVAAAQKLGGGAVGSRTATGRSTEKNVRASDANEVLLLLPKEAGVKGPPVWKYRRGRVFERGSGTTPRPWPMKLRQFPTKLLMLGHSVDSLRPFFTPEGAAYFATEQGQVELTKLVDIVNEARQALMVD
ncbi:MAG: hypothetical protein WC091_05025 [Sulfuricellaceae bacterium]